MASMSNDGYSTHSGEILLNLDQPVVEGDVGFNGCVDSDGEGVIFFFSFDIEDFTLGVTDWSEVDKSTFFDEIVIDGNFGLASFDGG